MKLGLVRYVLYGLYRVVLVSHLPQREGRNVRRFLGVEMENDRNTNKTLAFFLFLLFVFKDFSDHMQRIRGRIKEPKKLCWVCVFCCKDEKKTNTKSVFTEELHYTDKMTVLRRHGRKKKKFYRNLLYIKAREL